MAQAIERARSGAAGGAAAGEPIARRMAIDIFTRASAAGAVEAADLKGDATIFLIERAFVHLLGDPRTMLAFGPALAEYIGAHDKKPAATPVPAAEQKPAAEAAPQIAPVLAGLGLSPAMAQRLAAAGGTSLLADLRERFGLGERAMRRILTHIDQQQLARDRIIPALEELAAWIGDVRAQLTKPANVDADVRRLKAKAAAALADGDFEAAVEALKHVRRELREGRRRIEERLQDEVVALRQQMTEEARATARLAELALARGQNGEAADLFSEAALAMPSNDREGIWRLQLKRAEALYRAGETGREPRALTEALSAYNHAIRLAADGSIPGGLGVATLGLANTLFLVGEQEAGVGRLLDAAAAYRKAIGTIDRGESQLAWSKAHLQLGRTLALVGERQQAPAILRESADAFREGLSVLTAERNPGDFAAGQMGLGSVLLSLEEREGGQPLLAEAAAAFTDALAALDGAVDPDASAECQLNLGLAQLGIGEQQRSIEPLEAAAAAFRAAIAGYARDKAPRKWALAQMNLGNALAALGDRQGADGTSRLEESIAAYNAAAEEFPREVEPLKWAITQMNLGTALIRLGERRDKRKHWLAAAGALVPALEVFEGQGADAYADVTRRNLRRFHESWEQLISAPAGTSEVPPGRMTRAG
jgi:tetratricopeptide (TPR) repeat protein